MVHVSFCALKSVCSKRFLNGQTIMRVIHRVSSVSARRLASDTGKGERDQPKSPMCKANRPSIIECQLSTFIVQRFKQSVKEATTVTVIVEDKNLPPNNLVGAYYDPNPIVCTDSL